MDVDTKALLDAINSLRFQLMVVQLAAGIYVGEKLATIILNYMRYRETKFFHGVIQETGQSATVTIKK